MSETHTKIRVNPRQPQTDWPPRLSRQFAAAVGVLIVAVLTLSGCGEDEPKPIPKTSATPSVSPAPSAPALNAKQEADYKEAVQKYDAFQRFVDRVASDPKASEEIAIELGGLATKPATDDFSDAIDELIRSKAHTEGEREVAWSSPVSVEVGKEVVFLQCETPGTWTLVGDGKRYPDKNNVVTKVTVIDYKDNWFVKDGKRAGRC